FLAAQLFHEQKSLSVVDLLLRQDALPIASLFPAVDQVNPQKGKSGGSGSQPHDPAHAQASFLLIPAAFVIGVELVGDVNHSTVMNVVAVQAAVLARVPWNVRLPYNGGGQVQPGAVQELNFDAVDHWEKWQLALKLLGRLAQGFKKGPDLFLPFQ